MWVLKKFIAHYFPCVITKIISVLSIFFQVFAKHLCKNLKGFSRLNRLGPPTFLG